MKTNKRIAIFIDGGNFYHLAIKKIQITEIDFDFEKFAHFLANGNILVEDWKRYYTGTVREKVGDLHSKQSMARQTRFFAELKKGRWKLGTSKLKTRMETIVVDGRMKDFEKLKKIGIKEIAYERRREKGIDVMLATDLIVGAVEDKYDIAVVVSSDADLIPAINWVRNAKRKQVVYVGFSIQDPERKGNDTRPLSSLIQKSDIQRVLVESDLKGFIKL